MRKKPKIPASILKSLPSKADREFVDAYDDGYPVYGDTADRAAPPSPNEALASASVSTVLAHAMASRYRLVMVDECIRETQTGHQRRDPEETIDYATLIASLAEHLPDDPVAIMRLQLSPGGSFLDAGEMSLWAHALTRADDWLLCGADTASMKFGYDRRKRDHLVSLGSLLADIGHPSIPELRGNHRKAWLDDLMHRLAMGLL